MHVLVVTDNIPNAQYGGGALTAWSVIRSLRQFGHSVTALLLLHERSAIDTAEAQGWLRALGQIDVAIETLTVPMATPRPPSWRRRLRVLRQLIAPTLEELYPSICLAPHVTDVVARVKPDALFAYHWVATAASYGVRGVPRMAIIGDLDHLLWRYRWRYASARWDRTGLELLARAVVTSRRVPALLRRLLSDFEASGSFAAQHAAWLRHLGVASCVYVHTPVDDLAGPDWHAARRLPSADRPLRILMVGHLKGLATRAGLSLCARDILPALERALGPQGFEARIVGRFEPPAHLRQDLARPSVKLLGYVEDIRPEFFGADVLLVPTPIPISLRVRILTGMAFGCCVVAHTANRCGIPELSDGDNCLLASDGAGLARQIVRAWRDPALRRRVGEAGRRTYETSFSPDMAGQRLVRAVERIARPQAPRPREPAASIASAWEGTADV